MARINDGGKFLKKNSKLIPAKNAERERSRVKSLRNAFQTLQSCLPSVPPDTKLSKLDILILATNYISILMQTLDNHNTQPNDFQPFYSSSDNYVNQQHFTNENGIENFESCTNVYRPIKKWPMRSRLYSMIQYEHQFDGSQMNAEVLSSNNDPTILYQSNFNH